MRTKTKKFKTAQGFLENHYNAEFGRYGSKLKDETDEAQWQRSVQAMRNAVRALISAINLSVEISDDENLEQAVQRIQQMSETQNARHQYFLKGVRQWLKRARVIFVSTTAESWHTTSPSDSA